MDKNDDSEQIGFTYDEKREEPKTKETFWSNITLEPMWIGLFISMGFEIVIFKNLYIQRACVVDLGYPEDVCFVSGPLPSAIEIEAQKIISSVSVISGLVSGLITVIVVLFLGPWTDASGRRKPILLMSLGCTVVSSLTTLGALAMPHLPVMWVIFLKVLPLAFGTQALLGLAAFSYLGDICYTTSKNATVVMGRNGTTMFVSMVIGSALGPVVYNLLGFSGVVLISFLLQLFSFVYVYLTMEDVKVAEKIPNIFDIRLPINAFKCLFKKREGCKRKIVLVMMIIPATNVIIAANEIALRYLYLRNTFSWSEQEYATLLSSRLIVNSIGLMIIVKIMKEKLQIRDEVIGFVGGISEVIDALVFMSISKTWMLFGTVFFGIISSGPIIVERPVINKHISQYEQGQIYSVVSILEMFFSFSILPVCNYIYSRTLNWFPSCFMLISAIGGAFQILCYFFIIRLSKKEVLREKQVALTQTQSVESQN